jgi:hypothetical protein
MATCATSPPLVVEDPLAVLRVSMRGVFRSLDPEGETHKSDLFNSESHHKSAGLCRNVRQRGCFSNRDRTVESAQHWCDAVSSEEQTVFPAAGAILDIICIKDAWGLYRSPSDWSKLVRDSTHRYWALRRDRQ